NQPFSALVEALDASNQLASSYTGTISFSVAPADSGAMASAGFGKALTALSSFSYQFSTNDHGIHLFRFELTSTNATAITASDGTFSASATTNAAPETATTVMVETLEQAASGTPTRVEVEILDQAGQVMRNFTGAVTVSSSDTSATATPNHLTTPATVPITYNFTAFDRGEHFFRLNF